jgi:hypothetical protein
VLTIYRLHTGQVTAVYKQKQIDIAWEIQKEQLSGLGITPTEKERMIHLNLSGLVHYAIENLDQIFEARDYLAKLKKANKQYKRYNKKVFRDVLFERWWGVGRTNSLSIKMMLISCWIIFRFEFVSFGLLLRSIFKLGKRFTKTQL